MIMKFKSALLLLGLVFSLHAIAETKVNVVGLFNNKALVMINGSGPHTLRAGQTKQGVKLVSANSSVATLVIEGKRQTLGMGQAASVGGGSTKSQSGEVNSPVHLYADPAGHYFGNLTINGTSLKYVVDTGASSVSMNSSDAKRAGISYKNGRVVRMATANGVIPAYQVTLNTLKIGTIVLHNISATVIEGSSPPFVLLGMSAQKRLDIKQENSVMTLTKKY